jgi:hypothetical protein
MNNNRNYALVASMFVVVILAVAYLIWTDLFSQPIQQNPTPQVGILQASPIILCSTSPDTSIPEICPRRNGTTISALTYATSIATNFTCVGDRFSGTCNTTVTNTAGAVVLSGSSSGSSTCTDNRLVCQVPLDAPNMPADTYRVSFTVVDNNSRQSTTTSADVTIVR